MAPSEWKETHETELRKLKDTFVHWAIDKATGKWKETNLLKKWYQQSLKEFIEKNWNCKSFEEKQELYLMLKLGIAFHVYGAPKDLPAPWFVQSLSNVENSGNNIREMSAHEWKDDISIASTVKYQSDNEIGANDELCDKNDGVSADAISIASTVKYQNDKAKDANNELSGLGNLSDKNESKILKQLLSMVQEEKMNIRAKYIQVFEKIRTKVGECNDDSETYEVLLQRFKHVHPEWRYNNNNNNDNNNYLQYQKESFYQNLTKLEGLANFELAYDYYSEVLKLWAQQNAQ